mmetsp:Transcript_53609/g.116865  ORF Transcript_53609/g.116865 Transcript_53609/m.116865 type:complete len:713 (-) Transcript_53609:155-2293(-)
MAEPNFVQVGGSEYSLTGLVTYSPLQDLLRGLAAAISSQQRSIEHVRLELQSLRQMSAERHSALEAQVALKASEKALAALAVELAKESGSRQKAVASLEVEMEKGVRAADARMSTHEDEIDAMKRELETKSDKETAKRMQKHLDTCASKASVGELEMAMKSGLNKAEASSVERHEIAIDKIGQNTERIIVLEETQEKCQTKAEAEVARQILEKAQKEQAEGLVKLSEDTKQRADKDREEVMDRFAVDEEVRSVHWGHIRRLDELMASKAQREEVVANFEVIQAETAANAARAAKAVEELQVASFSRLDSHDERLKTHGERIHVLEEEMVTKSTHEDINQLREWLHDVPLRDEAREMVERVRTEASSRIRMLKERLDHTDRELLRQLEDSHALDTVEKYEALTALIDQKADRDVTDRWLESSSQLHSELQTLHVRSQTLGQGMKVVLGWVEGMADKVAGLQGTQSRIASEVKGIKSEQRQVEEEVSSKTQMVENQVRSLLEHIETTTVKSTQAPVLGAFTPTSVRTGDGFSSPRKSHGLDLVVLKQSQTQPSTHSHAHSNAQQHQAAAPQTARTASASTSRRSLAPWQHEAARPLSAAVPTAVSEAAKFNAMGAANGETEHAHGAQETAAEPARACSARQAAVPSKVGLALPGADMSASRPISAPFKSMAEQRKHQLDEKRKELVDARLKQVMPPACPPPATASPRNQGFQGR